MPGQMPRDMSVLKKSRGGVEYRERVEEQKQKVMSKIAGAWSKDNAESIVRKVLGRCRM